MSGLPDAEEIIAFWHRAGRDKWYKRSDAFDSEIRRRFADIHAAALSGRLDHWRETREGALALILLLDQFARNMFRGTPHAFTGDARARGIANHALAQGFDRQTPMPMRQFFYMPFMHSEDLRDQERCVRLFEALGSDNLKFAIDHRDIIKWFGRFPHRNPILGRTMTEAEQDFLDKGGFSG